MSAGARAGGSEARVAASATIIRPPRRWEGLALTEVWRARELVATLALRDVKLRYKQTVLGIAWVVLQPLLAALAFAFVFGRVARLPSGGVPYVLFALAGLLGWQLFATCLAQSANSLVANAQLVSKVCFPRLVLPLSTAPAALLDLAVAAAVLGVLMAAHGVALTPAALLAPLWIALVLALALGLGLFGAALAASYRDVQRMLPLALPLLLYASPVAYSAELVRERAAPEVFRLYMLNPLAPLLESLRWSLLGTPRPAPELVVQAAVLALVALVGCALFFRHRERRFADVL
jgi:lipopolysaccharide transport system permease protein